MDIVSSEEKQKPYFCLAVWAAGALFTLLKGIDRNPWGVGIFDLDFLTLLIGYLFLSFSRIQAVAFALIQGLFVDVFSSGPNGLSALSYLSVFWGIYGVSLFFNLENTKGQIIIISSAVFLKNITLVAIIAFVSGRFDLSRSFFYAAAISVVGTGLLAPILYAFFDRLRDTSEKERDAQAL